ncbi:MAG: class A sortase [Turicibacter sp.]|nr:class A sortase [Turicibacter sp.]
MKKLKNFLYLTTISLLIMAGLVLIMSPWIKNTVIGEASHGLAITGFTQSELASNNSPVVAGIAFDDQIEVLDFQTVLTGFNQISRDDVIGAIAIYDLGMLVPILNGTTSENLIVGATTMIEGQVMGEGNFALAGHHMSDPSLLFGPLLHARPGMVAQLTDKQNIYTYEITEAFMIDETDFWILEATDESILTLMTCDVPAATTKRWVVRAKLISQVPYEEESEKEEAQVFFSTLEAVSPDAPSLMRYAMAAPVALVPFIVFGSHAIKTKTTHSKKEE